MAVLELAADSQNKHKQPDLTPAWPRRKPANIRSEQGNPFPGRAARK
jgi:hypothetical protein